MKNKILNIVCIIIAIIIIVSLYFLVNGSLEMYPTEEQQEKVRIVSAISLILSVITEIVLIVYKNVSLRLKER